MATADFSSNPTFSASSALLQNRLAQLSKRRTANLMAKSMVSALIPAVAVAAISVVLYKLHIIPDGPVWFPAAVIGAGALWGLRSGLVARRGDFTAALDADQSLGLDDRLSSALSFVAPEQIGHLEKPKPKNFFEKIWFAFSSPQVLHSVPQSPNTNLVPALVNEAASKIEKLDPKSVYPFRFDRKSQILTALTVLFIGVCFMPDIPFALSAQDKKDRAAIMKEGEKLIAVSKDIRKTETPKADETSQLNKKLEKLGQKMARGRMTRRAALTEIGELKKQLQKAQSQKGNSQSQSGGLPQLPEAMKQAPLQSKTGREVQRDLLDNKAEAAAKKLEELADKLERGELSEKEKQDAAKDLEQVAKALRERGGEANKNAADKLEQAAKALREQQQGQQGQNQQGPQNGQNQQQQGQNGQQNKNGQQGQGQQQQGNQQQGQQGQKNQGQQNGQQQNGQQGQQGQKQQGQNGQQQQNGQQGQNGQKQNGQNQQGQQGGQQQQGQQGQKNQGGQQGQQGGQQQQGQQGQQGGQQQQGQQGQQGGQQQGGQQGGQQGSQQPGQGQGGASDALRDMANGLRQNPSGGGSPGNLNEMMNKLREAENGTNGGSQSGMGQGKQGEGQGGQQGGQQGQGQMKSITPGKDLKASTGEGNNQGGPGLGPRDKSTGNQGGGTSNVKSRRTGDKRRYGDVWSDRLPKTQKKLDRIKGKWGDSGETEQLPTRGEGKGGQATTPYYDVYESYKKDAEDAVGREAVPPAYKDSVKDYFESIKP